MTQEPKQQLLEVDPAQTNFGLGDLALYFLRLGTFGFGGPIALAGHMQRDLVDERHWFSKQDYLEGLAFSQLSPGPLAAQLAMYLGWLRAGTLGATTIGIDYPRNMNYVGGFAWCREDHLAQCLSRGFCV